MSCFLVKFIDVAKIKPVLLFLPLIATYVFITVPAMENMSASSKLSRGFGDRIKWQPSLVDGFRLSRQTKKPLMVIIHKTWCGACSNLKLEVANSNSILEESRKFVMINLEDDEEPRESKYAPDGAYIPRILFFAPNEELIEEVYNMEGSDEYKFYYSKSEEIIQGMRAAHRIYVKKYLNREL